MKVILIEKEYHLTLGKTYQVLETWWKFYWVINDQGIKAHYLADRFEIVSDNLQPGWHYCKCGTTTTNAESCCDCRNIAAIVGVSNES
jgi:hypothetical protein